MLPNEHTKVFDEHRLQFCERQELIFVLWDIFADDLHQFHPQVVICWQDNLAVVVTRVTPPNYAVHRPVKDKDNLKPGKYKY